MFKKTLIAATIALAAPAVFAQSGSGSTSTSGSAGNSNTGTINGSASGGASQNSNGSNIPTIGGQGNATATPPAGMANQTGALSGAGGFSALDKNGDGSLSRDEITGNSQLTSKFGTLDTDRNGVLSNAEFSKFESTATGNNSNGQSATSKLKDKTKNLNSPRDVNNKIQDNNQPSDLRK